MALFMRLGMASPSRSPLTGKSSAAGARMSTDYALCAPRCAGGNIAVASGRAAASHAGVRAVLVEEFGELFEHDAAQLLGVDDRDGAAVIAGHVVADADRGQFYFAEALDVVDHLAQVLFEVVAGVDG